VALELKGPIRVLRKTTMITAWYEASTSLFLNIFIIGYIILFVNCVGSEHTPDCKSGLGGKLGAVLILMIIQTVVQTYLAFVATWYFQNFEKDFYDRQEALEKKRSAR